MDRIDSTSALSEELPIVDLPSDMLALIFTKADSLKDKAALRASSKFFRKEACSNNIETITYSNTKTCTQLLSRDTLCKLPNIYDKCTNVNDKSPLKHITGLEFVM